MLVSLTFHRITSWLSEGEKPLDPTISSMSEGFVFYGFILKCFSLTLSIIMRIKLFKYIYLSDQQGTIAESSPLTHTFEFAINL